MENNLIKEILEDIYLIDSDLRKNEKELIKIIEELIKAKPEAVFDKDFSLQLRQEVLHRIEAIEEKKTKTFNLINFNFMKKQLFIGGGVLAVLIVAVVFFNLNQNSSVVNLSSDSLNFKTKITRINNQAFDLNLASDTFGVSAKSEGEKNIAAPAGLGGGGSYVTGEARMIAPDYFSYNYVYVGDDFDIPTLGDVYKQIASQGSGKAMAAKFNLDLGLLDLRKFKNTTLTNFSISEEREFGYQIYFNFVDNIVSIYENWNEWPNPTKDCQDEACFASFNLKIDDVPSDDKIIAMAQQGIKEYGIDVSMYGEPRVNQNWRRSYDMAEDKTQIYIPDTISVIYPLNINGQEVTDDYGYGVGLSVGVNVRYNKVSSISNIALTDFEASAYPLEQDKDRVIKFAEQGGLYNRYYINEESKKVEVQLGAPKIGLITNWKYDPETGRGENYYIPALIFPVVNEVDQDYYSRQSVSIPLLPELLDEADKANDEPIAPMPLMRKMEGGTASSEEPMIEEEVAPAVEPMIDEMSTEVMSR